MYYCPCPEKDFFFKSQKGVPSRKFIRIQWTRIYYPQILWVLNMIYNTLLLGFVRVHASCQNWFTMRLRLDPWRTQMMISMKTQKRLRLMSTAEQAKLQQGSCPLLKFYKFYLTFFFITKWVISRWTWFCIRAFWTEIGHVEVRLYGRFLSAVDCDLYIF